MRMCFKNCLPFKLLLQFSMKWKKCPKCCCRCRNILWDLTHLTWLTPLFTFVFWVAFSGWFWSNKSGCYWQSWVKGSIFYSQYDSRLLGINMYFSIKPDEWFLLVETGILHISLFIGAYWIRLDQVRWQRRSENAAYDKLECRLRLTNQSVPGNIFCQ